MGKQMLLNVRQVLLIAVLAALLSTLATTVVNHYITAEAKADDLAKLGQVQIIGEGLVQLRNIPQRLEDTNDKLDQVINELAAANAALSK